MTPWRFHPKRRSVLALFRRVAGRHPELEAPVTWRVFEEIAAREHIVVRIRQLPEGRTGMLVRVGDDVVMFLSRLLKPNERLWVAMHEMAHFWADDPGEVCYYNIESDKSESEEFCERFAWYCVDPGAREFLHRWREEGF